MSYKMSELSMHKLKTGALYVRKHALLKGDIIVDGTLTITKSTDLTPELEGVLNTLIQTDYPHRSPSASAVELPLIRLTSANYSDGLGNVDPSLINPRAISNAIFSQPDSESISNTKDCTDMFWVIGQFADHDLDLTPTGSESLNISVPTGDEYFDPHSTGTVIIPFNRSKTVSGSGITTPREHFTEISYELDCTNVYGSDLARANWLRTFRDGLLKSSQDNLLPIGNPFRIGNAGDPGSNPFIAGDVRANENTALLSMHTIWMREHNWWAMNIKAINGSLSDEELYQKARVMVEAEFQAVVYNEFLPLLVGPNAIPTYSGYNPGVSPAISTEFSTAAYRLGHSLISNVLKRVNNDNTSVQLGDLELKKAFFDPEPYANQGDISTLIRGLSRNVCQKLDAKIVGALRNFLFGPPGAGGLDLASLNIQRGRDHGLPDYNSVRTQLGMAAKTSFSEITSNTDLSLALSTVYGGDISKIDMWVGGLSEDPVTGSQLGELFQYVIVDQFTRTRDGDEFWYLDRLDDEQIDYVNNTKLSDIIARNSNATNLKENVFQFN